MSSRDGASHPSKLRLGLIGCGFFAINQLQAWLGIPDVEIAALCDRDPLRLAAAASLAPGARCYEEAGRMLAAGGLDFVDIATTVPTHRALVELAAAHRVGIICQKPMAASLADARAMVEAAARAGVAFMVHENFRWQTPIRAVRAVLEEGRIGQPFWGRFSFRSGYDVYARQPYLAEGSRFIIEDLGIHVLDIARALMGEAISVAARTQRVNPAIRGEDVATILLGHESGASSVVDCSYASRLEREPFPQTLIEIDATGGSLRLGLDYRLRVTDAGGTTEQDVAPPRLAWAERPWHGIQESVQAIQLHWVETFRAGREPQTSGADNLRTLALVEAAYESAGGGVTVRLAPDRPLPTGSG